MGQATGGASSTTLYLRSRSRQSTRQHHLHMRGWSASCIADPGRVRRAGWRTVSAFESTLNLNTLQALDCMHLSMARVCCDRASQSVLLLSASPTEVMGLRWRSRTACESEAGGAAFPLLVGRPYGRARFRRRSIAQTDKGKQGRARLRRRQELAWRIWAGHRRTIQTAFELDG